MPATPEARGGPVEVTVIVPVRNEGAHVDALLGDLLGQDFPPERLEVLVVDGQSTDDTRARAEAVAARDPRVRVLDNPRRLSSAARALGASAARGRFLVYVDGHCRIDQRRLLADMVDLFDRTGADGLARPQPLVPSGGGARARAIAAARTSPFGHSVASEIYGDHEARVPAISSGAMYRREVFARIGPFDPAFDACEDVELNYRFDAAGLVAWTSPRLAVRYEPRRTYLGLFRQMHRYGLGRARLHRKHPAAFSWESLVPIAFLLGVGALCAAPLLPRPLAWAVWGGNGLYALLALLFAVSAASARGLALAPLVAIAFPVIHAGLGLGYLRGRLGAFHPEVGGDGGGAP